MDSDLSFVPKSAGPLVFVPWLFLGSGLRPKVMLLVAIMAAACGTACWRTWGGQRMWIFSKANTSLALSLYGICVYRLALLQMFPFLIYFLFTYLVFVKLLFFLTLYVHHLELQLMYDFCYMNKVWLKKEMASSPHLHPNINQQRTQCFCYSLIRLQAWTFFMV